jgi:hypothetical protein
MTCEVRTGPVRKTTFAPAARCRRGRMPPGHYGSVAQTTSSNPCSRYSPAKDERVPQDALGLIDSPLPGPSWHTDALTAAFFFVSSLKAWRFQ